MKITKKIYESLSNWGNHPAIIDLSSKEYPLSVSAGELKSRIDDTRDLLKKSGILENDIAALFMENSVDFVAVFLALIEIGAKPVPVNLAYRAIELDEIFSNAEPHAIITESYHLPVLKPYATGAIVVQRQGGILKKIQSSDASVKQKPAEIKESIASINYTYRGYGYPLGAMISHEQYLHGAEVFVGGLRPVPGENMLVVLPFTYIFPLIGCLCVPLLYRITSILSGTVNPLHLFGYIKTYKINIITAVPEVYELMCSLKDESISLSSLTAFVSGGSRISEEWYERIQEAFNVEYLHGYGLTEFTPVSRNMRGEGRPGTIGPVCSGVECRIDSPEKNGVGEISIRSSDMAKAYYRRSVETAEAFNNGWFKTGDIGKMEDSHLVFIGEKKRTRKIKGNMVDLEEVRRAIRSCPNISDAQVECKDNILSAWIHLEAGKSIDEEVVNIKKHLEHTIARYKIPKVISRIDGL